MSPEIGDPPQAGGIASPQPEGITSAAACAVIIDEHDRILLVKPSYRRRWDLPGGMLEDGEQPVDALVRELVEEIGVRPVAPQLTGTYHVFPRDALRYVFRCTIDGAPHPDGVEILACEFVPVAAVEGRTNPWVLDRVLDAMEFAGHPVRRVQVRNAWQRYTPSRSRPW